MSEAAIDRTAGTIYLPQGWELCTSVCCSRYIQYFFLSRNIGQVTLEIIYFQYLKKHFLDQSIQQIFYLILETEALDMSARPPATYLYNYHK